MRGGAAGGREDSRSGRVVGRVGEMGGECARQHSDSCHWGESVSDGGAARFREVVCGGLLAGAGVSSRNPTRAATDDLSTPSPPSPLFPCIPPFARHMRSVRFLLRLDDRAGTGGGQAGCTTSTSWLSSTLSPPTGAPRTPTPSRRSTRTPLPLRGGGCSPATASPGGAACETGGSEGWGRRRVGKPSDQGLTSVSGSSEYTRIFQA